MSKMYKGDLEVNVDSTQVEKMSEAGWGLSPKEKAPVKKEAKPQKTAPKPKLKD